MWNDLRAAVFLFYKYITRGSRGTLFLTILVASLAFMQINIISGLMSGAVHLIYKQAKSNYVSNIVIKPGKDQWGNSEQYLTQVSSLKRKINAIPGIVGCSSRYSTGAIVTYDPDKTGKDLRSVSWPVTSISPEENIEVSNISWYMVGG
jgi:putative ABC transport system permease protein